MESWEKSCVAMMDFLDGGEGQGLAEVPHYMPAVRLAPGQRGDIALFYSSRQS